MKNNAKSHCRLDISGSQRTGFGNADMQRVIRLFADDLMCLYAHQNIGGFDADDKIVVPHLLDHGNLLQGALNNALRCHAAVLFNERLFQGTAVYADADRHPVFLRLIHNCLHAFPASDVSRIDADLVCAALHGCNGKTVIKMDVCHQRNMDLAFDCL